MDFPQEIESSDGRLKMIMPAGWVRVGQTATTTNLVIHVTNHTMDASIGILDFLNADISDPEVFASKNRA